MLRALCLLAALFPATAAVADQPRRHRGEFLRMFDAIVSGQAPGNTWGWFGPSECRYTWERLKAKDKDGNGRVSAAELGGSSDLFAALDRDGDGAITADDLDWSDNAPYFRQLNMAQQVLRRADGDGNKKLSKAEWEALFDELAKGRSHLEAEDVRRLMFPPAAGRPSGGGGMPPRGVLLFSLLTGELGSAAEGPKLNGPAPDFTLSSPDGKTSITLGDYRGKKPVVLIFGSFT